VRNTLLNCVISHTIRKYLNNSLPLSKNVVEHFPACPFSFAVLLIELFGLKVQAVQEMLPVSIVYDHCKNLFALKLMEIRKNKKYSTF
jgi:hypothetical protein